VEGAPGVEEPVTAGNKNGDGALEIGQLRHGEFVSQSRAASKDYC
jgi:hypothetical protein